jgi:GH18 family chitinase
MKKALYSFFTLLLLLVGQNAFSQKRAVYYLQNASSTTNVQWTKMTHMVHSFFNPMGTTGDMTNATGVPNGTDGASIWFVTSNFTTMRANALAANPALKIIISVGGAPTGSDPNITNRLNTIFGNAAARTEMANDLTAFIQNYNLDGFDLDLEHPVTVAEKNNHETFLALMRTKLDAIEATMCKELEISIALNGETDQFVVDPSGADYVNPGVNASVDYYHLMTYDASYAAHNAINSSWPLNHSPLIHAQEAVRDFSSPPFNWPKSKMVVGIPFYGRNGAATQTYAAMPGGAAKLTDADDVSSSGYNYNDCPTIQDKVNLSITEGLAGVLVWEASQDEPHSSGYSLASCLWTAITGNNLPGKKCCTNPNIGPDRLTCSTALPTTLDANITGGTFQWIRLPATALGTTQTQSATVAGTYVVVRTINGCISSDTVVVSTSAALPTPALSNRTLCSVPYTLTPSNLASFPTGTTFQWQKNSVNLAGETSSTLYASNPDTYTLVASLGGCTGSSGSMTLSASSISPVDACRTTAGTLTLGVTGGTGPFTWYDSDLPGNNVVASNTSTFTTPSLPLPSTTYYYVEDAAAVTNVTIGQTSPTFTGSDFSYDCATTVSMEFDVKAPVKIKTVDIYLGSFGVTFPVALNVEIFNDNNQTVFTSGTQSYPVWVGAAQTITLNAHLPIGKYRMRANPVTSDPSLLHKASPTFPYNAAADLTITRQQGTPQYGPFFNWQIGDYNACPRVRVRAVVAATCSSVFLPIDLDYFEAEKNGDDVLLDWITSAEKNNDYFQIERSLDGVHFSTIGQVEGNGTSLSRISYSYLDVNAPKEVLYYRLAQYDINGDVSYSPVKIIKNNAAFLVSIKPNPTSSSSEVQINGVSGDVQLNIFDISGKLLKSESTVAGDEISIGSSLNAGVYVIQVISSTSVVSEVFIKE